MKKKKILGKVLILALLVFLGFIVSSNNALAVGDININDEKTIKDDVVNDKILQDYTYYLNPLDEKLYTKKQKENIAKEAKESMASANSKEVESELNANAKYTTWANCRKTLQKGMVNRKKTIKLYWQTKTFRGLQDTMYGFYNEAVSEKYAYSTDLGDYMALTHAGWQCNIHVKYKNGYYKYYLVYTVKYKTTYAQEKKLKDKIKSFKKSYNPSKKSNFEKIYDIHEFICDNVTYDHAHFDNSYYRQNYLLQYTAYAAMLNKTAVCQGYATLYYKMLKECGINNRVIVSQQLNHSWNYIKLNGKWYHMDVTWDDNSGEANGSYMIYFMKGIYDFTGHDAYDMSPSPYSYDYSMYGLDLDSYRIDITNVSAETKYYQYRGEARQYDGKLTYHGAKLRLNKDYRIDYSYNNVQVGTATAQVTGLGKFKGTGAIKYYIILPAPNSFYTTEVTSNSVSLCWTYDSRAAKYIIKNKKTNKVLKEVTGNNVTTIKLSPATKYDLSVQAVTYVENTGAYKNSSAKTITVYTKPSAVTGIKATEIKSNQMKLSWKKVKNAKGYKIYIHDEDNDLSWTVSSTKNTYTLKGLEEYTRYTISIAAYTNTGIGKNYGEEGYLHDVTTTIKGTYISKVTAGKKKATINWKASNSSEGYILYMKTGKKGKFKKIKDINNNSTTKFTKTGLKKGTTYYFKIRTFKTINGKKVYSYYSDAKSVKIK